MKNKALALTLTMALLVFLLVPVPKAHSTEFSAPERVLTFLTDVVKLDTAKYNVTLVSDHLDYPSDLSGLPREIGKYNLEFNGSKLHVTWTFYNKTLFYCYLYVDKGSPFYTQTPSANVLYEADAFLQRYQNYTGDSNCQTFRNVLENVTEIKDMTTVVGNTKLTIDIGSHVGFDWICTFNGADYTKLSVSFFDNGAFSALGDTRHIYKIGGTEVNVSKDEAVSMARKRAENLTFWVNMGNNTIHVTDFTIVDDRVDALLLTAPREPLVLYPYWKVNLYLDKLYPGNVYGFTFDIWADKGELYYGNLLFFMGSPPSGGGSSSGGGTSSTPTIDPSTKLPTETTSTPPIEYPPEDSTDPTTPPAESESQQPAGFLGSTLPMEYGYAIVALTIVAIAVATGYLFLKRRK
jgi:hypothetical protein